MKSLTKKELSEKLQHVYKQLADIKEDYRKSIENNELLVKIVAERDSVVDKAIEYINSFEYYIPEDNVSELLDILKGMKTNE